MTDEKNKGGRPQKTTADFPHNWEIETLELYKAGASDVEIYRGVLDICHETFTAMMDRDALFSETIKRGRDLSRMWWERQGRVNLENPKFTPTTWYMNMKNRFGWADKHQVKATHAFNLMPDVKINGEPVKFKVGEALQGEAVLGDEVVKVSIGASSEPGYDDTWDDE